MNINKTIIKVDDKKRLDNESNKTLTININTFMLRKNILVVFIISFQCLHRFMSIFNLEIIQD